MGFDTGQYPPPKKPERSWDAKRDGYSARLSERCAKWLGAFVAPAALEHRILTNPDAFIRIPEHGLVWPIDFRAFVR